MRCLKITENIIKPTNSTKLGLFQCCKGSLKNTIGKAIMATKWSLGPHILILGKKQTTETNRGIFTSMRYLFQREQILALSRGDVIHCNQSARVGWPAAPENGATGSSECWSLLLKTRHLAVAIIILSWWWGAVHRHSCYHRQCTNPIDKGKNGYYLCHLY